MRNEGMPANVQLQDRHARSMRVFTLRPLEACPQMWGTCLTVVIV